MTERYKVSRYVTRVELDGAGILLLYGGLGGRLVEVPLAGRAEVEALLAHPDRATGTERTRTHQLLIDNGILVPAAWDEADIVRKRYARAHDPAFGAMSLTVCPTVNCNYRCTYCYQRHVGKLMPEDVQDRLLAFLGRQSPAVSSLSVTWFGGEPLLGMSVIERMSERFQAMVGPERYSASMISNGWLLTPDVSAQLVGMSVTDVQITLDGPRDVHDARRPLAGGQPTFDRIVANMRHADPRLGFSVRVNTDTRNLERVGELFDQLDQAELRGRVRVYFAPVTPYTEVCADTAGHCLAGQDWSRANASLRLMALERGYGGPPLPSARTGVCIADNPRGWVVTPDGLFFKCWNDVTAPERAVYDLVRDTRSPAMEAELARWQSWSPFKLSDCSECKVLPQCLSGCSHLAMQQTAPITHGDCTELKWNLPATLATYYLAHQRRLDADRLSAFLEATLPPGAELIPPRTP